jgi:uncharacterized protein
MHIVPIYASLLALLFVFLSAKVILTRRSLKIGIGDSGNTKMLRAIRVHSNFAEYVPLSLILLFFLESRGGHFVAVHFLAGLLVFSRLVHAYGVSKEKEKFVFRVTGMATTFTVILTCALYLLYLSLVTAT